MRTEPEPVRQHSPDATAGRVDETGRRIPASRDIFFLATCLCDAFFDGAARAAVEVLEAAGCTVTIPERQTCCGQPAFNAGDWEAARKVVRHTLRVFRGDRPVVIPSGSCAAMLRHGARLAFENEPEREAVEDLARRTWEMTDYLVHGLGIRSWPGAYRARVAFHRSCHSRGTGSSEAARQLLDSVEGLELVEAEDAEQCCGFGGTFSVAFPHNSVAMADRKIEGLTGTGPDCIAALDLGCLMHTGGRLDRRGLPIRRMHVSEILREARFGRTS